MRQIKMKTKKRILPIVLLIAAAVIAAVLICYGTLYFPRVPTMTSVKKITDLGQYNVYEMDYTADYKLDEVLAAGAGSTQEFTDLALKTLLPGIPVHMDTVEIACSVCFTRDSGGKYYMGRNFDLDDTSCMVIRTHPKNGYASVGMANLSYLGIDEADTAVGRIASLLLPYTTMDGMNEKGFACSMLWLDDAPTVQDTGKVPITTTVAQRLLLDRAANVDEAIGLLAAYDMRSVSGGDYHFYLTDAAGNSAIVEWPEPGDEMTVTRDVKIATNFFVCDVAEGVNVGHGQERAEAMTAYLDGLGNVAGVPETFGALESAEQTVRTEVSGVTQWSSVYDLTDRKVHLVFRRDWENVLEFDF